MNGELCTASARERRNVGRIDHIILLYRNRANQDEARRKFTDLLGIEDWQEVGEGDEGIYIWISWQSGIELICPTRDVPAFQKHLDTHGEGFYAMVFGVEDLERSSSHIQRISGRAPHALGKAPGTVFKKFTVAREAIVGMVGGMRLMVGEFESNDG
jgi:hypothetical protein